MIFYLLLPVGGLGLCLGMAYVADKVAEDLFRVRSSEELTVLHASRAR